MCIVEYIYFMYKFICIIWHVFEEIMYQEPTSLSHSDGGPKYDFVSVLYVCRLRLS